MCCALTIYLKYFSHFLLFVSAHFELFKKQNKNQNQRKTQIKNYCQDVKENVEKESNLKKIRDLKVREEMEITRLIGHRLRVQPNPETFF